MKALAILSIFVMLLGASCSKENTAAGNPREDTSAVADTGLADVIVDCAETQGNIMRIEKDNNVGHAVAGAKTIAWMKQLHHKIIRVWIGLRYVYNNGNINYNVNYSGSDASYEQVLSLYSACTDSLLIVLSAYNANTSWSLPRGADFLKFIKETLLYYKQKYPKIKYVTVGNEPDLAGERMTDYYPVYQDCYKAVNEVNETLHLADNPVLISNGPFTGSLEGVLDYADGFVKAYAADQDPGKRLDFFSFNNYAASYKPAVLINARARIDSMMESNHLPAVPVFVNEYGSSGSIDISGLTLGEAITLQPACQLTKAFYFYEGGISEVFNWVLHFGDPEDIVKSSQIADLDKAYPYPYGYALSFCDQLSERKIRIKAASEKIESGGLGIHALAAMGQGKGLAVLLWNYHWKYDEPDEDIRVRVDNIPADQFANGKIHARLYLLDSKHNNYYYDKSQTALTAAKDGTIAYQPSLTFPVTLEKNAVALILLTPQ